MTVNKYSRYWLGDRFQNWNRSSFTNEDLMKLAQVKRAISNFVRILTNKDIPVHYKVMRDGQQGVSGTNFQEIIISSDMSNFDVTCGLALHEGSHIVKSDNNVMLGSKDDPYRTINTIDSKFASELHAKYPTKDSNNSWTDVFNRNYVWLGYLVNWIEDRRIDSWVYKTAPGYRGYYVSLYNEYFNNEHIDKGLRSAEYRTADWASYDFRITQFTNSNTDLDALPDLRKIYELIDLKNIDRLKNSMDVLNLTIDILKIIESHVPPQSIENIKTENKNKSGDGTSGDGDGDGNSDGANNEQSEEEARKNSMTKEEIEQKHEEHLKNFKEKKEKEKLSNKEKRKLDEAIEKVSQFLEDKIEKKGITEKQNSMVEAVDHAGTESKEVSTVPRKKLQKGMGSFENNIQGTATKVKVIVVNKISEQFINVDPFQVFARDYQAIENQKAVDEGIQLGTSLGHKLQIRNEERSTKFTRLRNGKMDKRLIHTIGYGAEQIFEQTMVDIFNPVFLHISIDASGSMDGAKWFTTQKSTVAIAKAASMVSNLHVQISYRTTTHATGTHLPIVIVAYDSRVDSFNKVKQLFKWMEPHGTTPEGLCFEAIENLIVGGGKSHDSYFINYSDGAPGFHGSGVAYGGDHAYKHTREQVNKMSRRGIKIMSYYIGGGWSGNLEQFREMYGNAATAIDVESLIPLAKTLNRMFSTKER